MDYNDTYPWLTTIGVLPLVGAVVVGLMPAGRERLAKQVAVGFGVLTLLVVIGAAFAYDSSSDAPYQLAEKHDWIRQFGISYSLGLSGISLALVAMTAVLTPVCLLASWDDADGPADAGGAPVRATSVDVGSTAASSTGATSIDATSVDADLEGSTTGGRAAAVGATSIGGTRGARRRPQTYFGLVLVLEALMLGVFMATDVFLFYVFFEAMLVPMYFIIGGFGGVQRSYAAVKFFLYSLFGGLLMLASLIGLYVQSLRQLPADQFPHGTFDLVTLTSQLQISTAAERLLFAGFFIAFAIKAPLWPLHTWLPDAAAEAPSGGAVLMVSVMDKVGTFGMLTLCLPLFPDASRYFGPAIIVLALIAIIYGALLAIGQSDLKRLIAYTSVSHFGFIIMGIFAMTTQGQSGSTLYMVNHGFSTAGLFLVVGMLSSRRGSRLIQDFGGVQRVAPLLAGTMLIAGLSSLALPGLSSFVSEFLVLVGTFDRYVWAGVIGTVGIVLAAIYILLMYQRTMTGPVRPGVESMPDLRWREAWVLAPLIAIIVALGFYPRPLLDVINPTVRQVMVATGQEDPAPTAGVAEGTGK